MKRVIAIALAGVSQLLLLCTEIQAQPDWTWQNPQPQGNDLRAVSFSGSTAATAVGDCGSILRTTDGGSSWSAQSCPHHYDLRAVFFRNDDVGVAVGGNIYDILDVVSTNRLIIKTTNGGDSWSTLVMASDSSYLNAIAMTSATSFVAVGYHGTIVRTLDAGTTWATQGSGTTHDLNGVSFSGSTVGLAVGSSGTVLRTSNGGTTWTSPTTGSTANLLAVCFLDLTHAITVGSGGTILRTTNGGNSWAAQSSGTTSALYSVAFANATRGIAVGADGVVVRTTNGGTSWTSITSATTETLKGISFADSIVACAVGTYGTQVGTTDGGITWTEQGSTIASATLYGVDCPTTRIGTAVGAEGTILRTENGGANWHSQTSGTRYLLRGVSFVSADTGTTVGTMGTILRTVDGLKWKAQTSGTIRALNGVSFTTSKIGTIVGSSGTILRTTDGGTNWDSQTSGTTRTLNAVVTTAVTAAVAVGDSGTILRTTNSGTTWVRLKSDSTFDFLGVSLATKGTLVAVGGKPPESIMDLPRYVIYKSTNSGLAWSLLKSGYGEILRAVSFSDASNGLVVGDAGIAKFTTDGGENWLAASVHTYRPLHGVSFVSSDAGTIVGDHGTILGIAGGTTAIGVDPQSPQAQPEMFHLVQNYPNPFNAGTVIGYRVQGSGVRVVRLAVFDLLGREVAVLVNEKKAPGNYEVQFNASGLASGMYFYRLTTNDYTQCRTMVLLK